MMIVQIILGIIGVAIVIFIPFSIGYLINKFLLKEGAKDIGTLFFEGLLAIVVVSGFLFLFVFVGAEIMKLL